MTVVVGSMRSNDLDAAVAVWREANIARGAPHGPERVARVREKLIEPAALPFVARDAAVVGMALAEPGRFDRGRGELDRTLLHVAMVFVHPSAQGQGIGGHLIRHIFTLARSGGFQRVDLWTGEANAHARKLYERVGMTLTGETAPGRWRSQVRYERVIG
jgi:ribosomal protein S18 acetylase RimI-like enzyme